MKCIYFSSHDTLFIKIYLEKSYDRVEWSFIQVMLKDLEFGPTFSGNIETIFVDALAWLSINIRKSKEIDLFPSIGKTYMICKFS
jgi:hypothetical protein